MLMDMDDSHFLHVVLIESKTSYTEAALRRTGCFRKLSMHTTQATRQVSPNLASDKNQHTKLKAHVDNRILYIPNPKVKRFTRTNNPH